MYRIKLISLSTRNHIISNNKLVQFNGKTWDFHSHVFGSIPNTSNLLYNKDLLIFSIEFIMISLFTIFPIQQKYLYYINKTN